MEHQQFTTISLGDWQEFKLYIQNFSENWAFRGQGNAAWTLNNAIERTQFIRFHPGIEAEFVGEFKRGARNYLNRDELPEHLIEWLALMQHHGAPTRLLDLTKSPYIAAYFAFEETEIHRDRHVAVWCINIDFLRHKAIELLKASFGEAMKKNEARINQAIFEKIFYNNSLSLVFPVEPFSMNRRYSLQQSIFISTGTSEKPLMEQMKFLEEHLQKTVVKIELPSSCKRDALRELQQMNLHRASLFPDLDGYALSLKLRYENKKSPDEYQQEVESKLNDQNYPFYP